MRCYLIQVKTLFTYIALLGALPRFFVHIVMLAAKGPVWLPEASHNIPAALSHASARTLPNATLVSLPS